MRDRRIRLGMVGGGPGSLIGAIHRMAARLDDEYVLVAGCFSRDADSNNTSGQELRLASDRVYGSFEEMAAGEAERPPEDRIECVVIATPNNTHFAIAKTFLEHGFHVICDKPMTTSVVDARELVRIVEESGLVFVVTYNYSGTPMVREARRLFCSGEAGTLRKVLVEYLQDGLARPLERQGVKQAVWRMDPMQSGPGGTVVDIGTHADHLVEYVTGERVVEVCADTFTFGEGRTLDDDAGILLRFENGARGVMAVSQIAVGQESSFILRAFGDRASVTWSQEDPNYLRVGSYDEAPRLLGRGARYLTPSARDQARTPAGHPEGFIEAFAGIYRDTARLIRDHAAGLPQADKPSTVAAGVEPIVPDVQAGLRGILFAQAVADSAAKGGVWQAVV